MQFDTVRWLGYLLAACSLLGLLRIPALRAENNQPGFVDRTLDLNVQPHNGAACWADLNNDGWPDLCAGDVWINEAGNQFRKMADGVGSVVAADFDNDGLVDFFSWSSLTLWRNHGGTGLSPVDLPQLPRCVSRGACWGDFNGDAWVDLYIGGYEDWNAGITYPDMILLSEQGKTFRLAWNETRYRARGVSACDFDRDGDLDIYVSNYRLQPNVLWRNDGSAKFQDVAATHNAVATSTSFRGGHSIGAAWGDFNNDGHFDLFAGNFAHVDARGDQPKSRFLRNLGAEKDHAYEDLGTCGIFYQESYASPSAADFDNDSNLDLYFTTVYGTASFNRPNYPVLMRNDGDFSFTDHTRPSGLDRQPPTYQAAWADFDRDGDVDLATAGKLLENRAPGGHWLEVRLAGNGRTVNRSAIGAQVRLRLADKTLTRHVEAGTGEGNQNDLTLHFGLGDRASPVDLEINWPHGQTQKVDSVPIDQVFVVQEAGRQGTGRNSVTE